MAEGCDDSPSDLARSPGDRFASRYGPYLSIDCFFTHSLFQDVAIIDNHIKYRDRVRKR